jgi:hypothetical protein
MKLRTYDGSDSIQSFLLNYNSCVKFNDWDESHQFLALQSALREPAANVMWTSAIPASTASELVEALKNRFGNSKYLESLQAAICNTKKEKGESTPNLYGRVLTLMAAAYPGQHGPMYEAVAKQVYSGAWPSGSVKNSLKFFECHTVEEMHNTAMRIEASGTIVPGAEIIYDDQGNARKERVAKAAQARARSISPDTDGATASGFDMQKLNDSLSNTIHKAMSVQFKSFNNNRGYVGPSNGTTDKGQPAATTPAGNDDDRPRYRRSYPPRDPDYVRKCWNCGEASHVSFRCPKPLTEECKERQRRVQRQPPSTEPEVQPVAATTVNAPVARTSRVVNTEGISEATIEIIVAGVKCNCLLDTGADFSLARHSVLRNAVVQPASVQMTAANGTGIKILGQVEL